MNYNIDAIEAATDRLIEQGVRVLNAFLLAEDETAHAHRLLELMRPPEGAVVLDAGCGVGELARLMHAERPDLTFKLLNVSVGQLAHCPDGMERINAPYECTGLEDGSVDVVLFAFSLCHAQDWGTALREAFRVLRPEGTVFIFDMARAHAGSNAMLRELLQASAFRPAEIMGVAHRAGLELVDPADAMAHMPAVCRLRDAFSSPAAYETAMEGIFPMTLRLTRMPLAPPIEDAFRRHQRIAFQFSGGRDSMAAAWLLQAYWDRMEFYHLDTTDQFPELRAAVDAFEKMLGKPLVRIQTDVHAIRAEHGMPSDVVPVDNTPIGRMVSGRTIKIMSRYECCARALMNPMHERMRQDGITLIIRGQRDEEYAAPPKRSGDVEGAFEVLYPVQHMTAAAVDALVARAGLPVAPFYARGMKRAPECMGCTAWWDEGRVAYLREHHPSEYDTYVQRAQLLRRAIDSQMAQLEG
jgi:3'-phosphoadenosine 5'-phosphosulfate sulfotransferase (PAPS reductase)/FAD synthetase/SAM-dependent methyltransferase